MIIDLDLMKHIKLGYTFPTGIIEQGSLLTPEDLPEITSLGNKAMSYLSPAWLWIKDNRLLVGGLSIGILTLVMLARRR